MGFSRQEYWEGLPCSLPGDLPDPGIKSRLSALQPDSLLAEPPGKLPITNWRSVSILHQASLLASFFQEHWLHCLSLCHILVIPAILQFFSLLLSLLWWPVISDIWHYYFNYLGGTVNPTHIRWQKITTVYVLTAPPSGCSLCPSLSLGIPIPWNKRIYIDSRPINHPTVTSRYSGERNCHTSFTLKTKAKSDSA